MVLTVVFLCASVPFPVEAQTLPADIGTALILKALTYDRSLAERFHGKINIGILYASQNEEESQYARSFYNSMKVAASQFTIGAIHVESQLIEYSNKSNDQKTISKLLQDNNISVVVVFVHNKALLQAIAKTTQGLNINSFCTTKRCLEGGIAFGIFVQGNRPRMYVNLNAAREEGSDYSGKLLSLCETVK